jgi:hypothetical protein
MVLTRFAQVRSKGCRLEARTIDTAQLKLERHHSLPQARAPQPSFSCLKYDSTVFLISSSAFDSPPGDVEEAISHAVTFHLLRRLLNTSPESV